MKTKRNWLASIILSILLASLASPLIASQTSATEDREIDDFRIIRNTYWYRLESDIITALFPAGGQKPMFIWWHTNKPDQIYVVKFQGLIEWLAFDHRLLPANPETYNRLREAWQETWRERFEAMFFESERTRLMNMGIAGMPRLQIMEQIRYLIMQQMLSRWHRAYLPFNAGTWSLGDIHNITTSEGKVIGVAFAFTLENLPWMPNMQFAENNIIIRIRFYNETVEETVPGTDYKYTVNAGEMKMDLVVNKWEWNIDTLKELLQQLQQEGFDIRIPEGKSRLALWVNLASINMTSLSVAEKEPEEIEQQYSTTTHMRIQDDMPADVTTNQTQTQAERLIEVPRPIVRIGFANETKDLGGFFRFVSSAKISDYPETGDVSMVPVKAAYIAAGHHIRLFLGYPYFGNGTLEHDPSIGVDEVNVDTTPKYAVQAPSGSNITPTVTGAYIPPLFSSPLMLALIVVISATAILLYAIKLKRKTPVNMVGVGK